VGPAVDRVVLGLVLFTGTSVLCHHCISTVCLLVLLTGVNTLCPFIISEPRELVLPIPVVKKFIYILGGGGGPVRERESAHTYQTHREC
jgi:hypothetical protein